VSVDEVIQLEAIRDEFPGLTKAIGAYLYEAATVILDECRHRPGCTLEILSEPQRKISVHWRETVISQQTKAAWNDRDRATEAAAECVVLLLCLVESGDCAVERARKRTGIDYWIRKEMHKGESDTEVFQWCCRIGISGIFSGTLQDMKRRLRRKIKQAEQSADSGFPAWVVVVEFAHLRILEDHSMTTLPDHSTEETP